MQVHSYTHTHTPLILFHFTVSWLRLWFWIWLRLWMSLWPPLRLDCSATRFAVLWCSHAPSQRLLYAPASHPVAQPLHEVSIGFGSSDGVGSSRTSASFVVVVGRFGCFLSSHVLSYRSVCVCVAVDAVLHLSPCLYEYVHVCVCVWVLACSLFFGHHVQRFNAPCGIFGVSWIF